MLLDTYQAALLKLERIIKCRHGHCMNRHTIDIGMVTIRPSKKFDLNARTARPPHVTITFDFQIIKPTGERQFLVRCLFAFIFSAVRALFYKSFL